MFEIQNYYSFLAAIFLFQLIPGAGTIAILNATARGGVRSGMNAVFGTLTGDFIYMLSAVLGLAALLGAYPRIFIGLQYLGAAYLCFLGLKSLFTPVAAESPPPSPGSSHRLYFKQAFAVCLTNPKAIIFFMAFFPLFLNPDSGYSTLPAMMLHVTLISLVYQTSLVLLGNVIAGYLSRWKYAKLVATRLAGLAFLGFGLKLADKIK